MINLLVCISIPLVFLAGMFIGKKLGEYQALAFCCKKLREVDNEPLRCKR